MIPPTSIDGTDITGATIDGTDVTEITVDGDTVFSAQALPVAFSNLIAWYPFDSAEYGGSNSDDVTAIIGGSGDDTAYDGTVIGSPTYVSSGGVTDINAGSNSGAYEFDGTLGDGIHSPDISYSGFTKMCWFNVDALGNSLLFGDFDTPGPEYAHISIVNGDLSYTFDDGNASFDIIVTTTVNTNEWYHVAITYDASSSSNNCEMFLDGSSVGTASKGSGLTFNASQNIGCRVSNGSDNSPTDGVIDDCRFYDTALSSAQIGDIINNTPHP